MSSQYHIMAAVFIWLMGSISVMAHLHYLGIRDRMVRIVFGLFWPIAFILVMLSILIDIIWARGDVKRVQRAYDMKKKELEGPDNGDAD